MKQARLWAVAGVAAIAASASAQSTIPNEFESPTAAFPSLFAYFGGVQSFGTEPSTTVIHTGSSLRCFATFRHDNFFRTAGFAVGEYIVPRAGGRLGYPANADTFSITIQAPATIAGTAYQSGRLQLLVSLREDDDGDGAFDPESDDAWDSPNIPILPGTNVYNIPLASFEVSDPLAGNAIRNFGTTGFLGMLLTFETRTTYPGGIIESPASLLIDHAGLYLGAQSLPGPSCAAEFDGNPGLTIQDLLDFVTAWITGDPRGDFSGTGGVTVQDLFDYLSAYFAGCI